MFTIEDIKSMVNFTDVKNYLSNLSSTSVSQLGANYQTAAVVGAAALTVGAIVTFAYRSCASSSTPEPQDEKSLSERMRDLKEADLYSRTGEKAKLN